MGELESAILLLGSASLVGGFVAGYWTRGSRVADARNGAVTAFLAGVPLGALSTPAITVFSYVDPPPTYTTWQMFYSLLLVPIGVGVAVGVPLGVAGLAGGWIGYECRRQRAEPGE